MVLSLTYVADAARALQEMSRILKPGNGRAVIVDLLAHERDNFRRQYGQLHLGFDSRDMANLLMESGFEKPTVRPIPSDPNTKGPALFLAVATRQGEGLQ
jgi:ubiquinone/menaquinone biosynthesis C-methylase UbiE